MEIMTKVGAVLDRTKTPLALAGLVVLVLYGIYTQILSLGIFSTLAADQTYLLIDRITNYVFWLAILAIMLGAGGYAMSFLSKGRSG